MERGQKELGEPVVLQDLDLESPPEEDGFMKTRTGGGTSRNRKKGVEREEGPPGESMDGT